ncbi:MAG TPA: hypothetical protein DEQ74_02115 [Wolbachia sp.]|uniref:F0F1 ATP synthase subunit epsilon n=1 Tax=Wolbachia endosymbiont of Pentalonia nigronervosa TaxID=1301914 RepID=UPI000EC1FE00|nr:F0F1 ATP synthase subunit epsilon [Wolbachia endosymbiont of Pentalonia nigronervosa]MBD0390902.1 F0F1 ATP synthase subunit epsilon [Wolbachia endosymbiont of Pentalonia nigronervosa]HCE59605.1 hypothetical protein [Wolbachia sp.]
MNAFKVKFFSPDNYISFDRVLSVLVNGMEGKLMIQANHAPYLICILSGEVVVKMNNQKEEKFMIDRGMLEIADNNCSIVTSEFRVI